MVVIVVPFQNALLGFATTPSLSQVIKVELSDRCGDSTVLASFAREASGRRGLFGAPSSRWLLLTTSGVGDRQ